MKTKENVTPKEMNKSLFDDLEVKNVISLDDGSYTGIITAINRDTENFDYTRYSVKLNHESNMVLMLSFPTTISFLKDNVPSSTHAKFLFKMGFNNGTSVKSFVMGLVGTNIKFLITQKETEKGTFSEIVKDSVKLA